MCTLVVPAILCDVIIIMRGERSRRCVYWEMSVTVSRVVSDAGGLAVLSKNIITSGALANAVCTREEVAKPFFVGAELVDKLAEAANLREVWQIANKTNGRDLNVQALLTLGGSVAPVEDVLGAVEKALESAFIEKFGWKPAALTGFDSLLARCSGEFSRRCPSVFRVARVRNRAQAAGAVLHRKSTVAAKVFVVLGSSEGAGVDFVRGGLL